jgi:hypothetical protein
MMYNVLPPNLGTNDTGFLIAATASVSVSNNNPTAAPILQHSPVQINAQPVLHQNGISKKKIHSLIQFYFCFKFYIIIYF